MEDWRLAVSGFLRLAGWRLEVGEWLAEDGGKIDR